MTHREQPGTPGRDVLERVPGRWSPSRLASLPRRLPAVAAGRAAGPGAGRPVAPVAQAAEPGACGSFVNLTSFRIFPRYRLVFGDVAMPPGRPPPPGRGGRTAGACGG